MFIDEYFGTGYYKELPLEERSQLKFGRVCWTHAYYPHEHLEFFRPVSEPSDATKTTASRFQIEAAGRDAFNRSSCPWRHQAGDQGGIPDRASENQAGTNTQPEMPISSRKIAMGGRIQRKFHRRSCGWFGRPSDMVAAFEFNPVFVDRVRQWSIRQLMFLPQRHPGLFRADSLLRLMNSSQFSLPSTQISH